MTLIFLYLIELTVFHDPWSAENPTQRKVLKNTAGRKIVFFQLQDFLEHWIFSA